MQLFFSFRYTNCNTKRRHGENLKPREKLSQNQSSLFATVKIKEESEAETSSKRAKNDDEVESLLVEDSDKVDDPLETPDDMEEQTLTESEKVIKELKEVIVQSKEEIINALKKEEDKTEESFSKDEKEKLFIDSSRTVEDICSVYSELVYHENIKQIRCDQCATEVEMKMKNKEDM